jgi:hypothetical protein
MQTEHPPVWHIASDETNMTELRGLLCRLQRPDPAGQPLGGPNWDYYFSKFGREWWYALIADKCHTILERSKLSGKVSDPELLAFANELEESAKNRAVRRRDKTVRAILLLWTALEPRMLEYVQKLDEYTKVHGLKYTDKETPAKQHFILDHCAKYLLEEMRQFVEHYRDGTNTVKH